MGKGKAKSKAKTKPDKPGRAPQSAPYLSRVSRPAPHATIALTTHELLEAILLRLDRQTLLVSAQRVCTLWHHVITTSVRLQRRLFFLPTPLPSPPPPNAPPITLKRTFNPLLKRLFPCVLPEDYFRTWAVLPHFLCLPTTAARRESPFRMAGVAGRDTRPPMLDSRFGGGRRRALARAGASWRRMLPSDLPVRRVVLTSAPPGGGGMPEVVRVVEVGGEEGEMTMGEYYDAVCDVNFRRRDGSGEWEGKLQGVNGAWAAWRCKVVVTGESGDVGVDEEGGEGVVAAEGGGLVGRADLVIGELGSGVWWDQRTFQSPGCLHWDGPKGKFCLLRPERGKALFRSEDYRARDRLWLGPPLARRLGSEGGVDQDRIEASWEDWEDDSELE